MNIDAGRFRSALQIQNEYLSNQVQERKKIPQSENGFQDIFTKKLTDTNKRFAFTYPRYSTTNAKIVNVFSYYLWKVPVFYVAAPDKSPDHSLTHFDFPGTVQGSVRFPS